tara:strand:+ start:200 stop:430 length:231 start_codon:yes stop_codon:yes gene_type:complete
MKIDLHKEQTIFNHIDLKMLKIALENSIIEQREKPFFDIYYENAILEKLNNFEAFKEAERQIDEDPFILHQLDAQV